MQNKLVLMILSVFLLFTSCYKEVYPPDYYYYYEDTRVLAIYYDRFPVSLEPQGTYPDPFLIFSEGCPDLNLFRIIPVDPKARVSSVRREGTFPNCNQNFYYFYISSYSGLSNTKYVMRWSDIIDVEKSEEITE